MRRRSNAIHSESEEEYMLLAQYSQERPGYFYDERIREEVDRKLNRHRDALQAASPQHQHQHQQHGQLPGFDFDPAQQELREEEAEIALPSHRKQATLAVVVRSVEHARRVLASAFCGEEGGSGTEDEEQGGRVLQLLTVEHAETLFKIWIIKCGAVEEELLRAYLLRAVRVVGLGELQDLAGELVAQVGAAMGR